MAPRGRHHRKNKMVGNTRMDAALDSMRQFGFDEGVVRETIYELLAVYDGTQGWPFIEEASYRLLIETILGKQQNSAEEKKKEDLLQDHARRDEVIETSSTTTLTTGITEVGSSSRVARDSLLHTSDGLDLDSASQTDDQDPASLGNETDVKNLTVPVDRGRHEQGIRVESKKKPADNVSRRSNSTFVSNVESTIIKTPMIESSQSLKNPLRRNRKPCYGWIDSDDDDDDEVELITFPLPPLPEHIVKLIGQSEAPQSGRRRRRKSRWDEKPDGM